MMTPATIIGILAATASVASFAPQASRIITTREIKGLSVKTYALTVVAFGLWLAFGTLKLEWAIIMPNLLCLALSLFILLMLVLPARQRRAVAYLLDPDAS